MDVGWHHPKASRLRLSRARPAEFFIFSILEDSSSARRTFSWHEYIPLVKKFHFPYYDCISVSFLWWEAFYLLYNARSNSRRRRPLELQSSWKSKSIKRAPSRCPHFLCQIHFNNAYSRAFCWLPSSLLLTLSTRLIAGDPLHSLLTRRRGWR